jgi:hypothetical protein
MGATFRFDTSSSARHVCCFRQVLLPLTVCSRAGNPQPQAASAIGTVTLASLRQISNCNEKIKQRPLWR